MQIVGHAKNDVGFGADCNGVQRRQNRTKNSKGNKDSLHGDSFWTEPAFVKWAADKSNSYVKAPPTGASIRFLVSGFRLVSCGWIN